MIVGRVFCTAIVTEAPIRRVDGPVSCTWISYALVPKCAQQTTWCQEWIPGDLNFMYIYSNVVANVVGDILMILGA